MNPLQPKKIVQVIENSCYRKILNFACAKYIDLFHNGYKNNFALNNIFTYLKVVINKTKLDFGHGTYK